MPSTEHLNKGGNHGNVYGAGRPKAAFRAQAAKAALRQIKHWIAVAAGNKVVPVPSPKPGAKPTLRYPTHDEQERAYKDILLRYGIGTQDEVVVLGNEEVMDVLADVLADRLDDPDLIDAILIDLGNRLNGEGQ